MSNRNLWLRFEDWFWYGNHAVFEYHINQYLRSESEGTKRCGLSIRRVLCVLALVPIGIGFANNGIDQIGDRLQYYGVWG